MLKIENLSVKYGGISALQGIDLEVNEGEIVTLIGANGAGKSTTLRSIMGLVKPHTGKIYHKGKELLLEKTENMVDMGISLVPGVEEDA